MAAHRGLSRKQEQAIGALLTASSLHEAAIQSGISQSTLIRWLKDAAYREARRQVVQHAIVQVQQTTGEAVSTLRAVMADGQAPASSRVAAARTIIETAIKAVELEDLEARIAALEAQAEGRP